ncbi:recombinase family protein [Clostridium butyricum]|uniref:recombinase family protein n=3 Tax=Clostridia TaxID=186801 RepID=UPI0034E4EA00
MKLSYKVTLSGNMQVYYDYGSGLRQKGRSNLENIINKACSGQFDYILTKSLSRLSRNVLDTLIIIRKLKERDINMYFENENLNSIENEAEFAITLSGILAQEESRNLSENIQWGYQRKFENGDIFTKYKNFMGYKCENGNLFIAPEQAEVVKTIFMLYLDGMTLQQIKEQLESQQIKTATGKDVWATYVIQKMLKNEKYKGCTMFQKTFTEDYLTGKRKVNHGERAKYYVEDTHPAIVSKDVFDRVQEEMKRRERVVHNDDGSIETSKIKFNSK